MNSKPLCAVGLINTVLNLIHNNMNDSKELENERYQQEMRIRCIDYATRVVGKPEYLMVGEKWEKQQEDVVKVAERIYKFVTG